MQFDRLVQQGKLNSFKSRLTSLSQIIIAMIIFMFTSFAASNLMAGSSSAAVQVSAVVNSKCKINSGEVSFGNYDPASENESAPLNAAGNFSISCTKNTSATISIDQGQYAGQAAGASRAMKNTTGSNYLSYDLYLDANMSTVWNTSNQATYTATGGAAPTAFPIYAKVPASQDVSDGQYSDVVTVTAVF